jgi:phosphoribosylaminoimidazole-succinocarboxamide synthase
MRSILYQGSSKTLYETEEDYALIMSFDDSIKLQDKVFEVSGKGVINNAISSFIMQKLDMIGLDNHFIQKNNMKQQLVQFVDIVPVQVCVSTIACGRYVTEFGMENGFVFDTPIIDFRVKNSDLNYPAINEVQLMSFEWLTKREIRELKTQALRVHDFLVGLFAGVGIRLVDIHLEFGRVFTGDDFLLMLADEVSPDTCRLWDIETNEKLSFEVLEEGGTEAEASIAYQKVLKKLIP